MMNKLIVNESEISLNNELVNLDINTNNLKINISGNVEIDDLSNIDLNLELNILPNANLIYNKYNKNNNLSLNINEITNSKVKFNYSLVAETKVSLILNSNIKESDNECILNIHGLTKDKGSIKAIATADINKDIKNINMLENIRILMLNDEESTIIPNLLVSSDDVNINHNATISGIDKDYLFYLSSKGISKETAEKIQAEAFLKNNISNNLKEGIKIE